MRKIQTDTQYVIKAIKIKEIKKNEIESALLEIKILNQHNHPNIIHYHDWFQDENRIYIVMECVDYCDI